MDRSCYFQTDVESGVDLESAVGCGKDLFIVEG